MEFFTATQSTWFLIGPIAKGLGFVMNGIYEAINWIGLPNIGLAVILFTIVIKALLVPLSIKQQKTAKLQAIMQPELQAVQAKYKGKTDNASMMAQQTETKEIYAKYGTSMTGGCLQLIIQMPILLALYQVIIKLPGYINRLYTMFEGVAAKLMGIEGYAKNAELISLAAQNTVTKAENLTDVKYVIDMMYNFSPAEWTTFLNIFNNPELTEAYKYIQPAIRQTTFFLGIDLTMTPWELIWKSGIWWAVFIPILAGLFQWLSTRLSQAGNPQRSSTEDNTNPLGGSMKIMNVLFPVMSVVFCFMFNGGIGIYWVASSLVQLIIQLLVNAYMNKVDINAMVKKNVDKMNAKRIKKGQKPIKMKNVTVAAQNLEAQRKAENALKESLKEEQQQATDYYESTSTAKKGSLAEKAGMVRQYEERQKELKSGKK